MRYRWGLCLAVATLLLTACSDPQPTPPSQKASNVNTVINGRTFNFPVPKDLPSTGRIDWTQYKDFLIGAITTPTPPPEIWKPFKRITREHGASEFIKHYLQNVPTGKKQVKQLVTDILDNMIFVKGGSFMMGDYGWLTKAQAPMTYGSSSDTPHKVTLSSYSLMKNKVTNAEYNVYARATNQPTAFKKSMPEWGFYNYPALVNWYNAQKFCLWIGKKSGRLVDIDTSAQYEYAARSGGKRLLVASKFQKQDQLVPDMKKFRKLMIEKSKKYSATPSTAVPINTFGPNYLGFMDMIGSAEEWVYDWYGEYTKQPKINPSGPTSGNEKVVRTPSYANANGTINRWKRQPNSPYGVFRCAINGSMQL